MTSYALDDRGRWLCGSSPMCTPDPYHPVFGYKFATAARIFIISFLFWREKLALITKQNTIVTHWNVFE